MNAVAMQSFGFGDQLVRVHDRDGSAWFVGKDVCQALELANSSHALGDWKRTSAMRSPLATPSVGNSVRRSFRSPASTR